MIEPLLLALICGSAWNGPVVAEKSGIMLFTYKIRSFAVLNGDVDIVDTGEWKTLNTDL